MKPVHFLPALLLALGVAAPAAAQQELLRIESPHPDPDDYFGSALAVSGERLVVGALYDDQVASNAGAAFVFDAISGALLFELVPAQLGAHDRFGSAVAIGGARVIVGAPGHDGAEEDEGAVFVFDLGTGVLLYELEASDAARDDAFGTSLVLSGGLLVVGAPEDDDGGSRTGSAYVFDLATGQELRKLNATDAEADDQLGSSVAASAGRALVGAPWDDDIGLDMGAAYLFDLETGAQLHKLLPSNPVWQSSFGECVALSGDVAICTQIHQSYPGFVYVS